MLRNLSIRDYVIVERLDLDFGAGFTVLTGETGAGKSILIDALALLLGERADMLVIRQGAERAELTAEFDTGDAPAVSAWLVDNDLESEDHTCILRRVIDNSGRSRAFMNGRAVTLAQLRELGAFLVNIHGQHEHQSLLRSGAQRELLDGYGGLTDDTREVAAAWRAWQRRREARVALETNAAAYAAEKERLEWTARELEALAFTLEEWQQLLAEHARLAHAASLIEGSSYALEALSEGEQSTLSGVNAVVARLAQLVDYDPALRAILDVLEPAQIQLQEAVYALRHYQQKLELDPARLREVEQRLDAVHSAARRYRVQPEEFPGLLAQTRQRLDELVASGDVQALQREELQARDACESLAKKLSAARRKAAKKLAEQVTAAMQKLAMAGGAFEVALEPLAELSSHGLEQVEFRVAAHAGVLLQPLGRVASGGELSRVSLALQTAASAVAAVPTLIFDEVDAGIGGGVAEIVGNMLKQLGRRHQVLCVTHLPQVAASADQQWQVSKRTANGEVSSRVCVLDQDERVQEIARMLGGITITETTRRHAAEMLGARGKVKEK